MGYPYLENEFRIAATVSLLYFLTGYIQPIVPLPYGSVDTLHVSQLPLLIIRETYPPAPTTRDRSTYQLSFPALLDHANRF